MLRELLALLFRPREVPPVQQVRIDDQGLRSATAGYDFRFSCVVFYQEQLRPGTHPSVYGVARQSVVQHALELAARAELVDHVNFQNQLAAELGVPRYELNGALRVWAAEVVAVPAEADLQAVRRQRELERNLLEWQHQKEMERRERDFVAEMLREPQRAVAWWLSRNPQQVAQAVDMIEPLARLSATIHGRPAAPPVLSPGDQLLAASERLFAPLDEWNRALLGDQLAKTLVAFGHVELAERLRTQLDAPGLAG
ncbi:hypothetical protein [Kutzneria sp. CA-103260]|uniref:hypothetical protein n=1 Tax=Kutzneria sp. CA-103260 TaxID=2802641 RepID=UPI001BA4920F|nr:hypothetical protein [Kutzneria sp. CA-103260]QUQ71489.1 hypothetical protein JJ691_92760 [Kutzneria sp. CA-103260]